MKDVQKTSNQKTKKFTVSRGVLSEAGARFLSQFWVRF
jgi:hypothetical protein